MTGRGDNVVTEYDNNKHEYRIDRRHVPSVTQILSSVLGRDFYADEWYMQRGTVIHACAALIAQGKPFDSDPIVHGQVCACRNWFRDFAPRIEEIEQAHYDEKLMFAGRPDLICKLRGISFRVVIDWKSSSSKIDPYQLAAYGLLTGCKMGMTVVLNEDQSYKINQFTLAKYQRVFLAALTIYNAKRELKIKEE